LKLIKWSLSLHTKEVEHRRTVEVKEVSMIEIIFDWIDQENILQEESTLMDLFDELNAQEELCKTLVKLLNTVVNQ